MYQLSLFEKAVLKATHITGKTSKTYDYFAGSVGLTDGDMSELVQAGRAGLVNKWHRKIRFIQQTLKKKGLIARGDKLGCWDVTPEGRTHLTYAPYQSIRAYFVTKHGVALWGDANLLPELFDGEVELIVCSPPYILTKDRAYGNIGSTEQQYVGNLLTIAEGWLKMLTSTGSIVLNLNDSYKPNAGHQLLHKERLLIALEDKLGLHLVQTFQWWSPNRMPTGHWVCNQKKHCVNAMESFFWLSPDPKNSKADNQKVLVDYSERFKSMVKSAAGRKASVSYRPSGQRVNDETFYSLNKGAIPHNLLISAPQSSQSPYSIRCKELGLPRHPAMYPLDLPKFFIEYLTDPGDLVADSFLGSCTTGLAAEQTMRNWVGAEQVKEYLDGGRLRFCS